MPTRTDTNPASGHGALTRVLDLRTGERAKELENAAALLNAKYGSARCYAWETAPTEAS